MPAKRPRVFQPGTVTVVIGPEGQAVYVDASLLTMAAGATVSQDGRLSVSFLAPAQGEEKVLEEECRAMEAVVRGFTPR